MSKVFLVYDLPLDASLRYVKRVHSRDLGPVLWDVLLRAITNHREIGDGSHGMTCLLSEVLTIGQCGSRFLLNKTVQAVYEVGRVCGVDEELPGDIDDIDDIDDSVIGVFYIR